MPRLFVEDSIKKVAKFFNDVFQILQLVFICPPSPLICGNQLIQGGGGDLLLRQYIEKSSNVLNIMLPRWPSGTSSFC